jgi:hypothetical protein
MVGKAMIRHSISKLRHFAGQILFVASIAVGLACTIGSFVRPALAVNNVWTFDGDGNWSESGKWSLGVPADGGVDNAIIDDGSTAVIVTLDASRSVGSLTLGSDDTLLIQSTFNNSVSLQSNSSFTNAGTINVTSTDIQTTFLTLPGAAGNDTLTNTGTLNFQGAASTGTRVFTGQLVNSGTVNVNYDAHFNKSGATYTNTGQLTVPSGTTLTISNTGTLNQNAGGTFTLSGELENNTFNMNGGTLNFGATALVDNGNFNYLGGNIAGDVKLRNTTFTIGAGTAPETFQLNYNNTLASDVGAGHTINVQSTFNNSVSLQSNSSFTNAGTINVTSTDIQTTFLTLPGAAGNDTLTNTGTLNFQGAASTGTRVFTGQLVNSGTVNVDYSAFFNKSNATYTNNGLLKISNGSLLDITNGGTLTNQSGTTLTGGTFDLRGTLRYAGAVVHTNQAEIILRINGTIENSSGGDALQQLSVNGTSGKLRVLEGTDFAAEVPIFTNDGLIEMSGGDFVFGVPFVTGQRDFINSPTGQIIGRGTFQSGSTNGTFTNAGLISPGTSPGILQIEDEYTQTATGNLRIGINGNDNSAPQNPQFDVLKVLEVATLGGTLTLALDGSFTPSLNDTYTVFDAFSFSSVFANVANGQRLNTLGGEGSFVVTYNAGIGDVILSSFAINGDYNLNGIVDAADYVRWRNDPASFGGAGGYATWRSNFGRTNLPGAGSGAGSPSSQTAVPEPGTSLLVLLGMLAAAGKSRGRVTRE